MGVKWDIKAINHCLSVLISVREISEIGSHKSWLGDSTLRLHSSWRYRFIVLKTHSGEWRMRASRRLPALNLFQGRLAPPTDGGGEGGVQARDANPWVQCTLLPRNTQTSPRAPLEGGGGRGSGKRSKVIGFPSQMEGLAIKHGSGTNHGVWWLVGIQYLSSPLSSLTVHWSGLHENFCRANLRICPPLPHLYRSIHI